MKLAADEIEIVKNLCGLGEPSIARRHACGVHHVARHIVSQVFAAALRQEARPHQGAEMFEAGRRLSRLDCSLDLCIEVTFDRRLLGKYRAESESGSNYECNAESTNS